MAHSEKKDKLSEMVNIYEEGIKDIILEGIKRQEIANVDPQIAVQFIKGIILSAYLNWVLADMSYSLVDEKDKFMAFLKETILK